MSQSHKNRVKSPKTIRGRHHQKNHGGQASVTLAHVKAILKAGQILATVADAEDMGQFDKAADMYRSRPLTPRTGDQKIHETD